MNQPIVRNNFDAASVADAPGTNRFQALIFTLEADTAERRAERYCVNVFKVREILKTEGIKMSRMPALSGRAAAGFRGVANVRGEFIPVVDLAELLGLKSPATPELMMVTEFGSRKMVFLMHSVEELREVEGGDVVNAKSVLGDKASNLVTALVRLGDKEQATQLDVEAVLGLYHDLNAEGQIGEIPAGARGRTVMFVDDSATARVAVKALLNDLGVHSVEAVDGEDALSKIESLVHKPSVIVTDIEMPRVDGYTLTRRLKADSRFSGVPIIMYSSLSAGENVRVGKEVGADAYVPKFNRQALFEALTPFLQ